MYEPIIFLLFRRSPGPEQIPHYPWPSKDQSGRQNDNGHTHAEIHVQSRTDERQSEPLERLVAGLPGKDSEQVRVDQ